MRKTLISCKNKGFKSNLNTMFDTKILVFDGGIGTELYERGFYINRPFEELNVNASQDVIAIHKAYINAGAQVITTNTFSITKPHLKKFDIDNEQAHLIRAAIKNTNEARKGTDVKVAFSMGPLGVLIEPLGPTSLEEVRNEFADCARKASESGPFDIFILETFSNLSELECAVAGIRSVDSQKPIVASVTIDAAGTPEFFAELAKKFKLGGPVQALGLNCSSGPGDMMGSLTRLLAVTDLPVIVQPNAGLPRQINGRYFYMTSPDYLAKYAKRYVEAGASGVGGCCGTGPDHIRAISSAVRMKKVARVEVGKISVALNQNGAGDLLKNQTRKPLEQRLQSKIGQFLKKGEKIFSIELLPPKGTDLLKFLGQVDLLVKKGIGFVNIPDGARASTRVGSLHLAGLVNRHFEGKISAIPHFTTRDRNLIALQSDLLGAYVSGVTDILLVTGDPPKLGNNKDATAVYDIDSIGLTFLADCLNRGVSPVGELLGQGTEFGIGVASNPTAINLDTEVSRWGYKCESGADYAVTQPIFDAEYFLRWRDSIAKTYRPHVVGIWPLIGLKNAEFMANEVPGVKVPQWVLEEMSKAGENKSESIKRGIEIAQKVMRGLEKDCEGFCISAPLGKAEVALEVLG